MGLVLEIAYLPLSPSRWSTPLSLSLSLSSLNFQFFLMVVFFLQTIIIIFFYWRDMMVNLYKHYFLSTHFSF